MKITSVIIGLLNLLLLSTEVFSVTPGDELPDVTDCGLAAIPLIHGKAYALEKKGVCADQRGQYAAKIAIKKVASCRVVPLSTLCVRVNLTFGDLSFLPLDGYSYAFKLSEVPRIRLDTPNGELRLFDKHHCETDTELPCGIFGKE